MGSTQSRPPRFCELRVGEHRFSGFVDDHIASAVIIPMTQMRLGQVPGYV